MPEEVHAEMSLGEHLDELRSRMIKAIVGIVVMLFATIYFGDVILLWVCQPLYNAQRDAGLPAQTFGLGVTTGFAIWIKVSLISAMILAAPWVVLQAWRFVEAGLYQRERQAAFIVAPFSGFMTLMGVGFSYYVMLPVCLAFLLTFTVSLPTANVDANRPLSWLTKQVQQYAGRANDAVQPPDTALPQAPLPGAGVIDRVTIRDDDPAEPTEGDLWVNRDRGELRVHFDGRTYALTLSTSTALTPLIEIGAYVNFIMFMTLGVVVAFQLPPIMLVAGWSGLVHPKLVAKYRSYCVFGCFFLGALLTPADPISMLVLAIPLWGLFEFGLIIMRITAKKRQEAEANPPA